MCKDIACVAAPCICPPGARAKVQTLFFHRPLASVSTDDTLFLGARASGEQIKVVLDHAILALAIEAGLLEKHRTLVTCDIYDFLSLGIRRKQSVDGCVGTTFGRQVGAGSESQVEADLFD